MPVTGTVVAVSAAITAVTSIIGGANKAKNEKLRRQYEQNLAALELDEKQRLEKKILAAKTLEEKKRILAETLGRTTEERIKAINQQKLESKKTLNKLLIIGAVSVAAIIVGLIIYTKRKK